MAITIFSSIITNQILHIHSQNIISFLCLIESVETLFSKLKYHHIALHFNIVPESM
jgi:hypothetical protein